jgi:hypothetical protein
MSVYPPLTIAQITWRINTAGYCDTYYFDLASSLKYIERVTKGIDPEKLYLNVKRLKIYWRVRVAWRK